MITEAKRYVTTDGREFTSREAAEQYEAECQLIDSIMSVLPPRPKKVPGCGFENGEGYLQHDKHFLMGVKCRLLAIAKSKWPVLAVWNTPLEEVHPGCVIGRIIDDSGGPLQRAWNRMRMIDWTTYREYGQPFFAMNPGEAKDVCLNGGGE